MRTFPRLARTAAIALFAAVPLAVAGCSPGTPASTSPSHASGGATSGTIHMTFWGWAPGYPDSVKAFNASQSKIVVSYQQVQPGPKGAYQKMLTAVHAGNAPCLAQVGYETLPSFVAAGAVEDISQYANADEGLFTPASWNSVKIGNAVYGEPVDTGPMGLFYNKSLFTKYHISVPKTWAQYRQAGLALKKDNPSIKLTSPYMDYDYAGFDWQAGAPWFGAKGSSWNVSYGSSAGQKVSSYWQSLVSDGLVSPAPMYDQAWYTGIGNGTIATVVGAVWQAGVIKGGTTAAKGKWAVAPMPQWSAGQDAVGNAGGSSTAVLKGCATPQAAFQFAHFMSTDPASYGNLINKAGLYPAAKALLNAPQLQAPDPYFGGEKIFDVFKAAAPHVVTGWQWGPNMPEATVVLDDQLSKAWSGSEPLATALSNTQTSVIAKMKAEGLSVSG